MNDDADTFRTVLRSATARLKDCLADAPAGSGDTPYLDAVVLLSHACGLPKEKIFAALDDVVDGTELVADFALSRHRQPCKRIA